MTDLGKLLACAVGSIVVHAAVARALELLPAQAPPHVARPVVVRIVEREPPPEPPPEPPHPEPPPTPTPAPARPAPPRPSAPRLAATSTPPTPPPPEHAPANASDEPVFGISMASTSQAGSGPAMAVGGGGGGSRPAGGGSAAPIAGPAKPSSEPVPAYAVTTPPLPQGRCTGTYTDEARTAGVEGTVVLDLVVSEDGTVSDVHVTEKLGHGLDQAAVAALRACRFTPGEKDGHRVAVKVRGFKIRFVLSDAP